MIAKHMARLWTVSAAVCSGKGMPLTLRRVRFVLRSLAVFGAIKPIIDAPQGSPLAKTMQHRPETIGAVIWPYQCCGWDARTRLSRIRDHYAVVEKIGGVIDFPVTGKLSLLDLGNIREGFHVVLDQPKWFMHEGQLTINLFLADIRMYSLVFSLFHHHEEIATFIGAIQGRDIEGALGQYRELTKAAYGMRPRDLLIEIFRMFCAVLGVRHIFAVSDQYRDYQSGYFGDPATIKAHVNNYDEIWTDRGGVRVDPMFYRFDVKGQQRELSEVPAKKRSMYRQRYAMLDTIRMQMQENYCRLQRETDFEKRQDKSQPAGNFGPSDSSRVIGA